MILALFNRGTSKILDSLVICANIVRKMKVLPKTAFNFFVPQFTTPRSGSTVYCARAALCSAAFLRQLSQVLYPVDCQGLAHFEQNRRRLLNSGAISIYKYVSVTESERSKKVLDFCGIYFMPLLYSSIDKIKLFVRLGSLKHHKVRSNNTRTRMHYVT